MIVCSYIRHFKLVHCNYKAMSNNPFISSKGTNPGSVLRLTQMIGQQSSRPQEGNIFNSDPQNRPNNFSMVQMIPPQPPRQEESRSVPGINHHPRPQLPFAQEGQSQPNQQIAMNIGANSRIGLGVTVNGVNCSI